MLLQNEQKCILFCFLFNYGSKHSKQKQKKSYWKSAVLKAIDKI